MGAAATVGHAPAEHGEVNYIAIFIYLSVLTAIELAVALAGMPKVAKVGLLVGLAWAKAALVAMYFMHLRFERRTLALVAFTPIVLITFLTFMLLPDLTTRLWTGIDAHQQVTAPAESAPAPATAP